MQPWTICGTGLISPYRPQTCDCQQVAVGSVDEHRLLHEFAFCAERCCWCWRLPLVEAVNGNNASALAEQAFERRLLGERLGTGIDHRRPDLRVLRPHWNETPMEGANGGLVAVFVHHCVHVGSWCHVVVHGQGITLERGAEEISNLLRGAGRYNASTHASYGIKRVPSATFLTRRQI